MLILEITLSFFKKFSNHGGFEIFPNIFLEFLQREKTPLVLKISNISGKSNSEQQNAKV